MFRKIVSHLSFSPALVGQLAFYAKRLRKEEATRRVGLAFVILAVIVQCLAVFDAPQSANAASTNDFVNGGLGTGSARSIDNFLRPYDANTDHLKDIMNDVGISRSDITSATFGSFISGDYLSWGHLPKFSAAQGEVSVPITDASGTLLTTVYARPLKLWGSASTRIYGWIGHSSKVGWFAIMQSCGNLVTASVPAPPTPPPAPAKIVQSKTAANVSQGLVDASTVTAKADDQIRFTLTVKNTGGTAASTQIQDNMTDTVEYASILDIGDGTFDPTTKVLSWPAITLQPGDS